MRTAINTTNTTQADTGPAANSMTLSIAAIPDESFSAKETS
jgi:hypothetical protein